MTAFKIKYANFLLPLSSLGSIDEDVVVIEASSTPQVTANEEINVTSTDSEVEIVTVGESYRWVRLVSLCISKILLDSVFVTRVCIIKNP